MNWKTVLPWLCVAGSLGGVGTLYQSNQKLSSEVAQLRQEAGELQAQKAAEDTNKAQAQAANEELVRLRMEIEDVLRLCNELRQLKQEKQQLAGQVQLAQNQAQDAAARAEVLRSNALSVAATAEAQAAFRKRYGLDLTPEQAALNACVNNLRQIDGAKHQWALEHQRPAYSAVAPGDVLPYLRTNTLPTCPSGGIYTLNNVGVAPTCTIAGHVLPK